MPLDDDLRARALHEAMEQPDRFLAASLAALPDEALAAETGIDIDRVWQLRLKRVPRGIHWVADIRELAASVGTTRLKLMQLLARVGVRP